MLRRLLALLVVLAIALPPVAMNAGARVAAADCECPTGKSECSDKAKACDCGLVCVSRVVVADPALAVVTVPIVSMTLADIRPLMRATPPSGAPPDTPFRPPRSTISH
jgi:hypothetical protein